MCFDNDSDWTASIVERKTTLAKKPTKCRECNRVIQVGDLLHHVYQQEHEVCRYDPESDDYIGEDENADKEGCPEGCKHDFGETYDYDCCEVCSQLIEAIHQHELEEGCHESESRPPYEGLYDAFADGDGDRYFAKAEELYPGITSRLTENFRDLCDRFTKESEDIHADR
jgi:hypothetical protein